MRPELSLRSGFWSQEASCLGKVVLQRHQARPQFDEATVDVHQSPPKKNARKGKQEDGVGVDMPRRRVAAMDFIGRMLTALL
jgi:hypothetical protein